MMVSVLVVLDLEQDAWVHKKKRELKLKTGEVLAQLVSKAMLEESIGGV
jgi:hypothetical protein